MIEVRRIKDMGLVLSELDHLHRSFWEEAQAHRKSTFAPRYDLLKRYWDVGAIRAWGAFDGDRLVGHLTAFVTTSLHSGERVAHEDRLYVLPEFRKGAGAALVKQAIKDLKAEGIDEAWATCEPITRVGPLLKRQGFEHIADAYRIRLSEQRS